MVERTRLTSKEFIHWYDQPERGDRLYELVNGEIIEKLASFTPSRIAMRIGRLIGNFVDPQNLGYVTGADGTYILSEDHTYMPDVGYISKAHMPNIPEREVPMPPDLAVEVMSPTDSKRALRRKAETYLEHGTQMVWLVFPDMQTVEVYIPNSDVIEHGINDTIDGGTVLPSFTLAVKTIFGVE